MKNENLNKTALDLLIGLVASMPEVEKIYISIFPNNRLLLENPSEGNVYNLILNRAMSIRKELGLPFWDCIAVSLFGTKDVPDILIKQLIFHNYNIKQLSFNSSDLNELVLFLRENETTNVAINSKVTTFKKKIKHFQLIDFHIPKSETIQITVEKIIKSFGYSGYLLDSGKFFLAAPIVDKNWIAHQIIDGVCRLRLSKKNNQYPLLLTDIS